jgi:tetratricopeptide (TPR) repeat protein
MDAAALHYPDNPSVLDGFVMYYIYKKDYEKALPYIRKRLQYKETNNNVFEVFEALTLEALGKKEEAKIRLEALEKKSVGNPMYLQILGMMYIDYFNNEAKGIAYLEQRARRSLPTNSKVYYRLAVYTLKKGDKAAAIAYLEQALKHPPDFKKAKELYKQLTGSEGKKTDG